MTNIKTTGDGTVLTLRNDILFKAVFGSDTEESKTVLIALLNLILRREEDPIVDLQYRNPFQYRRYPGDKEIVLDIKVTTDSGDLIDIEMQMVWEKDFKERLMNYHGGLIRESLSSGQPYGTMKTTITIGIVDAVFLEEDDFLNEFYFINRKSHTLFSDRSYICCIELPKVNREKKPIEELTPLEICLEYLKHANENGSEYIDALIRRGGKELQMAQEILEKATEDEILREQAIARERFKTDMLSYKAGMERLARENEAMARENETKARENETKARENETKARENEAMARENEQIARVLEERARKLEEREEALRQREEALKQNYKSHE